MLNILGGSYAQITEYGKSLLIKGNIVNKKLAEKLNEKELISSFKLEKDDLRIHTYKKE